MSSPSRSAHYGVLALGIVLLASVAANLVYRTPMPTSAFAPYRDDAYYYFAMAESLARGQAPSVSEGVATNGGQFGWVLLLVPTVWLGSLSSALGPESCARWIGLGCLLLAGLVLGRQAKVWTGRLAAFPLAALALWSTPLLWIESQNGQETGLVVLACVLLLGAARGGGSGAGLRFTATAALALLARIDLLPFVVVLEVVRRRELARSAWPLWTLCALTPAVAANLLASGSWTSDAGAPMAWLFWNRFLATDPTVGDWLQHLWFHGRPALLGGPFTEAFALWTGAWLALASPFRRRLHAALGFVLLVLCSALGVDDLASVLFALALLSTGALPVPSRADEGLERTRARLLLAAAIGLVALHHLLRLYPRDYYWAPLSVFGVSAFARSWPARPAFVWVLLFAVCAFPGFRSPAPTRPWQSVQEFAAVQLDRLVPAGHRVGAFNAGLVRARAQRPVFALDGVVDRAAFDALRARRLGELLDERRIDWLCDHPVQLDPDPTKPHANGAWFGGAAADGFEVGVRFLAPGIDAGRPGTGEVVLWHRPGAEPEDPGSGELEGPRGLRGFVWRGTAGTTLLVRREGRFEPLASGEDGVIVVVVCGPELAPSAGPDLELFNRDSDGSMMQLR